MNTFLTGREGGTEADKEVVEEKHPEEVGSCGCEEAGSWCACSVTYTQACTQTDTHTNSFRCFPPD